MNNELNSAISEMTAHIAAILEPNEPSIYLYGSVTLDDFKLGWSDVDILTLTKLQITEAQAEKLLCLRQEMLKFEQKNEYYRSFEGGMLTLDAFCKKQTDRVVYWGTSGQRIAESYRFDSFCMTELLENGILLYGSDIRQKLTLPTYSELCADIERHLETVRKYARTADRSIYSFGWLLDIARCIYTLRTGRIIAKTKAAEWAIENDLCPSSDALKTALQVRIAPKKYKNDEEMLNCTASLAVPIQSFADVLEKELRR